MFSDLFLFRYGDTWTPWRQCSRDYDGDQEEMLELEPSSEEAISSVSGYSFDSDGFTRSLLTSTTAGRSWGPHGGHTPDEGWSSLRNSPGGKLRLGFFSGDQTERNYILRSAVSDCFIKSSYLSYFYIIFIIIFIINKIIRTSIKSVFPTYNRVCAQNQQNHHKTFVQNLQLTIYTRST